MTSTFCGGSELAVGTDDVRALGSGDVNVMTRLSPDELAQRLKGIYEALGNGQAAGGLFGLLYAAHLEAGSRDRSPNGIARRAGLTCGVDFNTGFLAANYVRADLRDEYAHLIRTPRP